MKKFYTLVSTKETHNGFVVELDGKPVRTPAGTELLAPNKPIADLIVREWSAQEDQVDPETMPVTQILTTCLDRVSHERDAMHAQVIAYLDTDLICYFHDDETQDVYKWQCEAWQPWHDWFQKRYDEVLAKTSGLAALKQSSAANQKVEAQIQDLDDIGFTVLQLVTAMSGSLVLALAFMKDEISQEEIFNAAFVEERYRAELYNEDFYGQAPQQEKKMNAMLRDLKACRDILEAA